MADVLHAKRDQGAIAWDFAVVECPHCGKTHRHKWMLGRREERCIKNRTKTYIVECTDDAA